MSWILAFLNLPEEVACLLVHPSGRRMSGDTRQVNTTRSHFNEEKNIQSLQAERFNREEIAGQDLMAIVVQKRAPRAGASFTLRRGRNTVSTQDVTECGFTDGVTQLLQFALQLATTPTVLVPQAKYQSFEFRIGSRTTAMIPRRGVRPFLAHQLAMPAQECIGLKQEQGVL